MEIGKKIKKINNIALISFQNIAKPTLEKNACLNLKANLRADKLAYQVTISRKAC